MKTEQAISGTSASTYKVMERNEAWLSQHDGSMFEDKLFFLPSQDTRTHKTHTCSEFLKIFSSKQDFRRVGFRQSIVRCKNWRAQHFLGPSESNRRLNFGLNGFGKCQVGVGVGIGSAEHKFLFLLFQVELIWSRLWYLIIPINDCLSCGDRCSNKKIGGFNPSYDDV